MHALSYSLADLTLDDELTLNTEAVWNMRTTADGRLLVSYTDPLSYQDPTLGWLAIKAADGSWSIVTDNTTNPPVHDFSALLRDNGDLVVVGAAETPAAAWISADDGATWTFEPIADAPDGHPSQGAVRAWTVLELDGTLHAWVDDNFPDAGFTWNGHYVRDEEAGTWAKVDDDYRAKGSTKVTVNGTVRALVLTSGPENAAGVFGGLLRSLDGSLSTWHTNGVLALNIAADGSAYWITGSGELRRGKPDGTTALVGTFDDDKIRSLAVDSDGGRVFFGTTDSRVLVADLP